MNSSGSIMQNQESEARRQFFRLVYPRTARLELKTPAGLVMNVVDLCEQGLRLDYESSLELSTNQRIEGYIVFHDGGREYISGCVIRMDARGAAVSLDQGISMHDMVKEQLFVRRHYPMHKPGGD